MITITRSFAFDSAHRIIGHENKCKHIHGHRYLAVVTIETNNLDALGRVIDFGVIKDIIGKWIDDNWDHNILLHSGDCLLSASGEDFDITDLHGRDPFIFDKCNPTAENIAIGLLAQCVQLLSDPKYLPLYVRKVRVYETPNCWADASR